MCRINEMLLNLIEQNMSFIAVPMTADNYDTVVTSIKAIANKHCIEAKLGTISLYRWI